MQAAVTVLQPGAQGVECIRVHKRTAKEINIIHVFPSNLGWKDLEILYEGSVTPSLLTDTVVNLF